MDISKIILLAFVIFLFGFALSDGNSSSCATIYKHGGAAAIFQSPECSRWALSLSNKFSANQTSVNCYWGMESYEKRIIQISPEDRVICDLNMEIPFYGQNNSDDSRFGMVTVFDHYEHEKISKLAPKFVKELFLVHLYFAWDEMHVSPACTEAPHCDGLMKSDAETKNDVIINGYQQNNKFLLKFITFLRKFISFFNNDDKEKSSQPEKVVLQNSEVVKRFDEIPSAAFDHTTFKMILREALFRTARDLSSTFLGGIGPNNLVLGCPKIVILVKGQVLVVNDCNSRAFICTDPQLRSLEHEGSPRRKEDKFPHWCISPFDNQPIPHAFNISSPQVIRRYGDVGIVSVTDWHPLTDQDHFLVVSSSDIFNWLQVTGRNACRFIKEHRVKTVETGCLSPVSYADFILHIGLLAANRDGVFLVVPLESAGFLFGNPIPDFKS